jgi:hypothetical protein
MMNTPSMYSVDQLLKARQNGVPDYVVVPMLQKAMAQKQAMAQQQALQQGAPKPPVAQQILDAAHNDVMQEHMARNQREEMTPVPSSREETKGIDSLPSGIDESDYAQGGIIAFNGEDGSDVPGVTPSTDNNIVGLRPIGADTGFQKFRSHLDALNAGDKNLEIYGRKHGIDTLEDVVSRWAPKGDGDNDPEAYAAIGHKMLGTKPGQKFDLSDPAERSKILSVIAKVEHNQNYSPDKIQSMLSGGGDSVGAKQQSNSQQGNPTGGIASLAYPSAPEDQQQPYTQEETTPEYEGKRLQDYLGEDPNMAKREARLSKREADLSEEKDRSPWMALMQAGLSTMAGTSPNAFANIGAGASEGLRAYGEARRDLSKSSDKLMDLRGEIEDAQYAHEQAIKTHGWDSAQANKKANLLVKKENQKAKWDYKKDAAEFELKKFEAENKGNLQTATADFYRQKPEMEANKTAAKLEGKGEMTPAQKAANELALERTANANLSKNSDYSMATPEQQALMKEQEIAKLRAAQQGGGTAIPLQSNVGNPNYNVKNYFK